jgi:brefeldin A-inhibited guanine nucleotide-exchange protein
MASTDDHTSDGDESPEVYSSPVDMKPEKELPGLPEPAGNEDLQAPTNASESEKEMNGQREPVEEVLHTIDLNEDDDPISPPSESIRSELPSHIASTFAQAPNNDSQSTLATVEPSKPMPKSSLLFVVSSLESIAASKDARRNKDLSAAVNKALSTIKADETMDPEVLFAPLQLAAQTPNVQVVTTALDCIGKLISYSYFSLPSTAAPLANGEAGSPPLIERAIDTICDCFQSEATPVETQLQIVKSLLSAILNDKIVVHGAGLLKAVRMTYNIFLLSKSSANQTVAQGALTQMVGTVFERVKIRMDSKEKRLSGANLGISDYKGKDKVDEEDETSTEADESGEHDHDNDDMDSASTAPSDSPVEKRDGPKITLQSFENRNSFDDAKITEAAPTLVTHLPKRKATSGRSTSGSSDAHVQNGSHENVGDAATEEEEDEIFVRDAYLVFRAMCRLTTKGLAVEHALDVKSQGMRSKLISLHIIYTILANHTSVFLSPYATIRSSSNDEPTSFVQAIKQYLCLSLSRNGASSVRPVFEVSLEIFWLMIRLLRVMLKKEIEVFLKEIYLAILEKRAAPVWQKQMILGMFSNMAADPRALVEVYLNYDCDRTALDNMFERIVEHLSRISSTPVAVTPPQVTAYSEHLARKTPPTNRDWHYKAMPPSLATVSLAGQEEKELGFPSELAMKHEALEVLVELLRSLVSWSQGQDMPLSATAPQKSTNNESRESLDKRDGYFAAPSPRLGVESPLGTSTPVPEDDPGQFDREKQRKTALAAAIRQFNFKPKRGVKTLIKEGFIKSEEPEEIARFLISSDQLNLKALGEFLGEGDKENIEIMHSFVELMDFKQTRFVDALRRFLQSFRLPGEAQKIDRFMLKFAERYIFGNPNAFANADTAYVLAYSVIMLNTDQHSANIKTKRMTLEDFIKNNRGINDSADLPDDYLREIYDEIQSNEIVLDTERATAANLGQLNVPSQGLTTTIGQAIVNAGKDHRREEYARTEQIANRTEQLYKSLLRAQKRGALKIQVAKFIPASSFKHVGPMFQVTWMPFLTALSGTAQDAPDIETVRLCMEGQKLAIRIACMFGLDDPRQAFVASLARFTNLYNLSEMKAKNMEALKVMLEIAYTEGNSLKDSWRDILTCVSQLDRFQLISTGVDEGVLPDVGRQHRQSKPSSVRRTPKKSSRTTSQIGGHYQADIAEESRSADIIRSVDRIFTNTATLDGDAIIYFVKALTQVSWQEIQSSGQSESPRTYSLQKLVEISQYNMTRVRFQWANIWQVLGAHFNQVGTTTNTHVVYFALDSLRQLSMRFLEIEELPGFKFQKDFLKPFEHIIANSSVVAVKDMVLRCLIQMIQARGDNIKSGWRTMFGVFTVAAREPYGKLSCCTRDEADVLENIVNLAYDHVTQIYNTRFGVVISQGAFADLIVCLTQFSKNHKFQKKSLQAIEALKASVAKLLKTPECPLSARHSEKDKGMSKEQSLATQTQEEQFWFPVLFAFHDVLMTGDDLEVRSRALNYLFETLMKHGGQFPLDFWDTLWRQLLYPIFMVLRSKSEMSKVANHEELSVWLSTTMVQALRNMVILFTHFFESLEYMLDRFLDLLVLCICQENDTLARIGSNCLQQLILQNVTKFSDEDWNKIVNAFIELFSRTEAGGLFSATATPYLSRTTSTVTNGSSNPEKSSSQSYADLNLSSPAPELTSPSQESVGLGIDTQLEDRPRQDWGSMGAAGAAGSSASVDTSEVTGVVDDEKGDEPKTSKSTMGNEKDSTELEHFRPESSHSQNTPVIVTAARRRFFNQIITQCVLTLLMIETVSELFSNDAVYASIPAEELLRLMALLKKSYQFARRFNADRELRTRLFKEGFMKQPPNLLKQESTAAATYVQILLRMYHDTQPGRTGARQATEDALVPLCADILKSYLDLDEETQARNIVTWRPVVVDVLEGYSGFGVDEFKLHLETFAPLVVGLLGRELTTEVQAAAQRCVARIVEISTGISCEQYVVHDGLARAGSIQTPSLGARSRTSSMLKNGGKY